MKKSAGYTLLEMVVATAILAILISTAILGVSAIQKAWKKSFLYTERLKKLLIIDRVVDSTIRNAVPFQWRDDNMRRMEIFRGDTDKVSFAAMHRITKADNSAIRFISFHVENGDLIASYRKTPVLPWNEDDTGIQKEVLSEGVEKISFLYADIDGDKKVEWLEDWDEENNKNIPMAIQITIYWKDGFQNSWLRRTAGSSKRETFGRRLITIK